jgi:branched-chain amino acid transport system ATP-binding protein
LAFAVSDHAYVIAEGRVVSDGPPATLAARPEIRRAYLGL